jgi:hypothetical protein
MVRRTHIMQRYIQLYAEAAGGALHGTETMMLQVGVILGIQLGRHPHVVLRTWLGIDRDLNSRCHPVTSYSCYFPLRIAQDSACAVLGCCQACSSTRCVRRCLPSFTTPVPLS